MTKQEKLDQMNQQFKDQENQNTQAIGQSNLLGTQISQLTQQKTDIDKQITDNKTALEDIINQIHDLEEDIEQTGGDIEYVEPTA
jgi:chromosome segregation ATPase